MKKIRKILCGIIAVMFTFQNMTYAFNSIGDLEEAYAIGDIQPTEEPFNEESSLGYDIDDSLNYIVPEETDISLINDTMQIEFNCEDEPASFDDIYFKYSQVITGNEDALEKFEEYIAEKHPDMGYTAEEILAPYFTNEEIEEIILVNSENTITLCRLAACLLESDISDEEKESVKNSIAVNYDIGLCLNTYMDYKRAEENGYIEDMPVSEYIADHINIDEEFNTDGAINQISAYSVTDVKKEAYTAAITAPKFYSKQSDNISVETKSGNLVYTRNDVNIPMIDGTLTLPLQYDQSEAKGAGYSDEEWESGGSLHSSVSNSNLVESPLGVGWRFNLTRIEDDILYLSDGRTVAINDGQKYKYDDFIITDDPDGLYMIRYVDGSIDCIDEDGLMYEHIDRHKNTIRYTYEKINNMYVPVAVTGRGKTVTIEYNDDDVVINKPDGDKVRYIKGDRSFTYGSLMNKSWSHSVKTLDQVEYVRGSEKFSVASFYYGKYESSAFSGTVGGMYTTDFYAYISMSEIGGYDGSSYNFEYTSGLLSTSGSRKIYNMKVAKKIIYRYPGEPDHLYSTLQYSTDYNAENTTVKERFENNKEVVAKFGPTSRIMETYEVNGNTKLLRKSESISYKKDREYIPETSESMVYNRNGNYITSRHDYTYNSRDQVLTDKQYIEDELNGEYIYEYDDNNYLVKTTYKKDGEVLYDYITERNTRGDITVEYKKDPNDSDPDKTEYTYDSNYRLISKKTYSTWMGRYDFSEEYEYGNICLPSVVKTVENNEIIAKKSYTYNPNNGNVLTETDGNGNTTMYLYDVRGNVSEVHYPDGSYERAVYNDDGYYNAMPVEYTNKRGLVKQLWYDYLGRPTEEYYYEAGEYILLNKLKYDLYGNLISATDANGNVTTAEYDIYGRQISVTYPAVDGESSEPVRTYYYDVFFDGSEKCSAAIKIDQTNKAFISFYDLEGQNYKNAVIKNMSSLSSTDWENITSLPAAAQLVITQTNVFDDLGRVTETCDGENRSTRYVYDILGRVKYYEAGDNTSGTCGDYSYNSFGAVILEYPGSQQITREYDLAGRLTKQTDTMGYTETYTYDMAGNVTSAKDKNGVYTYNTYDNMNRLIKTQKGDETIEYTYEVGGNVKTVSDSNGEIEYSYNLDGTMNRKTYADGRSVLYFRDENQNIIEMEDCFGNTTYYTYNGRNQVTKISEVYNQAAESKDTEYLYNDDGSIKQINIPNRNMTTKYIYDYAGRVTYLNNSAPYTTPYAQYHYSYDNSGNITEVSQRLNATYTNKTYTYDLVNRLVSEEYDNGYSMNYTYDFNNNLLEQSGTAGSTVYTYDDNNRMMSSEHEDNDGNITNTQYSYDNAGNLLTSNDYVNGTQTGTKAYSYSAWGQLEQYVENGSTKGSYTYYSDGMRATRTTGGNTIQYYYDGGTVINETKNGSLYAVNVMGVDGYISRKQNDQYTYYFKDLHGNIVYGFSSGAYRNLEYDYNAWGESNTSYDRYQADGANPVRYCGEYYDEESGLLYLRGRYYSSALHRFITEDPAKDGLNWYAYCENNPVMFIDRSGLAPGDIFETDDLAAQDWGEYYYSTTEYTLLELSSFIYEIFDDDGNSMGFSYTFAIIGGAHSADGFWDGLDLIPENGTNVGYVHSHPNGTTFSGADKNIAEDRNISAYVVIPGRTLKKWESSVDTDGKTVWGERTVATDLQLRGLSIAEQIALTQIYKSRWDNHLTTCKSGWGCADKTWPKTGQSWNTDGSEFIINWMKMVLSKRYHQ